MNESIIEKHVTQYAKSKGWLTYKWHATHQKGVPDRLFFKQGKLVIIEFKRPGVKPTALQLYTHQQLSSEGFTVHVVDNVTQGIALLEA